jgi:hypothetical protein
MRHIGVIFMIFTDIEHLTEQIKKDADQSGKQTYVFGIDGMDGAGKSSIAQGLARKLDAHLIELDSQLNKDQNAFAPHLRCADILSEMESVKPIVIVEGVCLLDAIHHCKLSLDHFVYVKRLSTSGYWYDEQLCDPNQNMEDTIKSLTKHTRSVGKILAKEENVHEFNDPVYELSGLAQELIKYHVKHNPLSKANYVFHRVED